MVLYLGRGLSSFRRLRFFLSFALLMVDVALPAQQASSPSLLKPVANFVDIAEKAGLKMKNVFGGVDTKKYIIETTGTGVAIFDYDNDGWPDIFFVNGTTLEDMKAGKSGPTNHLYHNNHDGTFTDVTQKAGLADATGWGQGVCVGDYDNDGWQDLYVTYYGKNRLYHNEHGVFKLVSEQAGVAGSGKEWGAGCAFVDYDRDGKLDLFVANYVDFDVTTAPAPGDRPSCMWKGTPVMCGPRGLPHHKNILYHNRGDGTFEDVTVKTHIDQTNGHFGLGVSTLDYDNDGRLDIFKTNFSDDTSTLYHNNPDGTFSDVTTAAGLGLHTKYLGWGTMFFDFDNDSWPDLMLVNGHVYPEVDKFHLGSDYQEPRILYRNKGDGTFSDVSAAAGGGITTVASSRGLAIGDLWNTGQLSAVISNMNSTPSLLKNEQAYANHWVAFNTVGTKSNRDGIGARITLKAAKRVLVDEVRSGSSYYSQNDRRVHFGLGAATKLDSVEIRWPSGLTERFDDVKVDQFNSVTEGTGVAVRTESENKK